MRKKTEGRTGLSPDIPLFAIGAALLTLLLLYRCLFGFAGADEAFYLTVPYRLCQGDALFVDEWHPSQMAGFLLYLPVKLYLALTGSTEGIALAFRFLFVLTQLAASALLFALLRRYSKPGALVGALGFLVYAPYGIPALSYNSMGILCLVSGMTMTALCRRRAAVFAGGALFAAAVLCCPYLAPAYFLAAAGIVLWHVLHKTPQREAVFRKFVVFTAGIALLAVVFLAFVLLRSSLDDVLKALPHILSDPMHDMPLSQKPRIYVRRILRENMFTEAIFAAYALLLAGGFALRKHRRGFLLALLFVNFLHVVSYVTLNGYLNYVIFPLNFAALFCFLLIRQKELRPLFYGIWIPGMIYTFCLHLSSNQNGYSITSASSTQLAVTATILACTAKQMRRELGREPIARAMKAGFAVVVAASFLVQSDAELHFRWTPVFQEGTIAEQTERLTYGPEKGLRVTEESRAKYEGFYEELEEIGDAERVFFLTMNTWTYLCGEWRMGAQSAWLSDIERGGFGLLDTYYALDKSRMPDTIWIEEKYAKHAEKLGEYGYEVATITKRGNVLMKRP